MKSKSCGSVPCTLQDDTSDGSQQKAGKRRKVLSPEYPGYQMTVRRKCFLTNCAAKKERAASFLS